MITEAKPRQVLLVDDDPLVVKVYAERMRYEGWNVAIARDGWEAGQEAGRKPFDVILLDIRMPFHDGIQVLREIRAGEMNGRTPIYILTSMTEGEAVDDALSSGADGVFYKSATRPDELVEKVEEILVTPRAAVAVATASSTEGTLSAPAVSGPGYAPLEDAGTGVDEGRAYDVYVNPFLGDGAELCRAIGMQNSFQCPDCGGQVCLRLTPRDGEMLAYFLCSQCQRYL